MKNPIVYFNINEKSLRFNHPGKLPLPENSLHACAHTAYTRRKAICLHTFN
ncbi:MAG: hypothetical protein JNM68_15050 [Dinghuibacter sp.]|nr:hypothetical protein [Dinghuibacter sp.]